MDYTAKTQRLHAVYGRSREEEEEEEEEQRILATKLAKIRNLIQII